jgi:hypothetical protein
MSGPRAGERLNQRPNHQAGWVHPYLAWQRRFEKSPTDGQDVLQAMVSEQGWRFAELVVWCVGQKAEPHLAARPRSAARLQRARAVLVSR